VDGVKSGWGHGYVSDRGRNALASPLCPRPLFTGSRVFAGSRVKRRVTGWFLDSSEVLESGPLT